MNLSTAEVASITRGKTRLSWRFTRLGVLLGILAGVPASYAFQSPLFRMSEPFAMYLWGGGLLRMFEHYGHSASAAAIANVALCTVAIAAGLGAALGIGIDAMGRRAAFEEQRRLREAASGLPSGLPVPETIPGSISFQDSIKALRFWAAAGLVLFFFLPWISLQGLISLNGFQVADLMRQESVKKSQEVEKRRSASPGFFAPKPDPVRDADELQKAHYQYIASWLIYLVPVLGGYCIVQELRGIRRRSSFIIAGLVPIALVGLDYYQEGSDMFQLMSIGIWLTILSGVAAVVGGFQPDSRHTPKINVPVPASGSNPS